MAKEILSTENVLLNETAATKEEAIRMAGQILVDNGYVDESYLEQMQEREKITTTYMGNSVAIPHGTEDAKKAVKHSGLSIIQLREGVDFGDGNIAKIIIGIAGKDNEHLEILSQIAIVCSEEENVEELIQADSKETLISMFNEVN
ncbi:PTS mannitol transporter subunit IIA [Bacillus hwajinpoensis]|jgi:mannitol PTS system EIIA component|uniref:Mannitol-specific phosphotransferase enzyme IIA component n=1 Tax=Guptibacillus hwajinpoensis TaxID=208199 RepID=A0A845F5L4_9BACL|nr:MULTISPECIES: PTS sugar transporter subunit IIA [Bacillaceae]MCA0993533.1 PTS sugar transporter subunit IIA [Pseudalkalibacillus hwajinpoensis]MDO6658316.1 PTS sugar transporter subunit IIA [Anaerobacillus sp. 1_MG-2023]MYL66028.1 PTS mannitol transporter subunit IIA [Pseudalkalibacillus hwajinpoensis]WLR58150.1 PTS sugar transporter subunit IIA [Pseudalkalibacillus hwajinpoensis]